MDTLNYMEIQTPKDVWMELLRLNPINKDDIFYEPFCGEGSLYNQVDTNTKYWSEITKDKDVYDFDKKDEVTCIYTNPPFKTLIYNAKKQKVYKNSVFYFLDYFVSLYPKLKTIGFLINAKSFNALTPFRLAKLEQKGFTMSALTFLNTNYWFQGYYFVVFQRDNTNKLAKINIIPKTFTNKNIH